MSLFDRVFWLLILLIAVLAYCIESGLCVRHRAMILSSILAATVVAIFMMFLIDDNSSFGTGEPVAQEEKNKKVGGGPRMGSGGGVTEIDESAPADGDGSGKTIEVNAYEDKELLAQHFEWTHRMSSGVPTFSLVYPRDFCMLAEVRHAVRQHVAELDV